MILQIVGPYERDNGTQSSNHSIGDDSSSLRLLQLLVLHFKIDDTFFCKAKLTDMKYIYALLRKALYLLLSCQLLISLAASIVFLSLILDQIFTSGFEIQTTIWPLFVWQSSIIVASGFILKRLREAYSQHYRMLKWIIGAAILNLLIIAYPCIALAMVTDSALLMLFIITLCLTNVFVLCVVSIKGLHCLLFDELC